MDDFGELKTAGMKTGRVQVGNLTKFEFALREFSNIGAICADRVG
jgi:hypothetical protein